LKGLSTPQYIVAFLAPWSHKLGPPRKGKKGSLTNTPTLLKFRQIYLPKRKPFRKYSFWGIYEMDFPEHANMKAPRGSGFPFGAFVVEFFSQECWKRQSL
jgi:hypothetical protein